MKEVTLPSGAILKIGVSPFETSRSLYQAVLEEAKLVTISSKTDMASVYKDLFCIGFSSKKIEAALWKCFEKVLYCDKRGELKIDKDTFEPLEARGDYMQVCMAVAKENIDPFVKGLYAEYKDFFRDDSKRPIIEAEDDVLLIHFRLVKAGYGSLAEVRELGARTVLQALNYEVFCSDYEKAYWELNK